MGTGPSLTRWYILVVRACTSRLAGTLWGAPDPWMLGVTENGQVKQLGNGQENLTGVEPWCLSVDNLACFRIGNDGACMFPPSGFFLVSNTDQCLRPRTLKLGVVAAASNSNKSTGVQG